MNSWSFCVEVPFLHLHIEHRVLSAEEHQASIAEHADLKRKMHQAELDTDVEKASLAHALHRRALALMEKVANLKQTGREKPHGADEPDPGAGGAGR